VAAVVRHPLIDGTAWTTFEPSIEEAARYLARHHRSAHLDGAGAVTDAVA
jgi:hypothetical protein